MTAPHMPTETMPSEPVDNGAPAPVPPPDHEAITAALVQATDARMSYMRQQMKAAGHVPPGL